MNRHWPDEPDMRRALSLRFLAFALTPTLVLLLAAETTGSPEAFLFPVRP
jgi:hypothetical protein